jgi:hypothetical protein
VIKNDHGSMSFAKTNNLFHFEQTNELGDPEAALEDKLVQYTDDIIVQIKTDIALWYP